MTTVTSLTADRMLAIEAASVVDGDVVGDNLILTKHDGTQINAGSVRGPTGSPGPVGQDLPILTAAPILDVGVSGQIRAGRQLTAADFTAMGLSAPLGLWNLSDLSDVSGNGRNLLNKGAVGFATGINGGASTSAQFVGDVNKALYIPDTGANDPFRIKTGSCGAWVKTAKNGTQQSVMSKLGGAANYGWDLFINTTNAPGFQASSDGANIFAANAISYLTDDRWHFLAGTFDGTLLRVYVDGVLEGSSPMPNGIFSSTVAFNIGSRQGDSGSASVTPNYGRIDEAFVTNDILSEEQIRNLYCAKISHTLAVVPSRVSLNVHRRRKGATLAIADFSTPPLRLYNFSGGSLGDEGSQGIGLNNQGAALNVSGADGSAKNAYSFDKSSVSFLYGPDTGLPAGVASRTLGAWFKTVQTTPGYMVGYAGYYAIGLQTGGYLITTDGLVNMQSSFVADGQWHFGVFVTDSAPVDGLKERMYIDGRVVSNITTSPGAPLLGNTGFRIGCLPDGGSLSACQIDSTFVCDYALSPEQIAKLFAKGRRCLDRHQRILAIM